MSEHRGEEHDSENPQAAHDASQLNKAKPVRKKASVDPKFKQAHELYIKSKIYHWTAIIFAVLGFGMVSFLHYKLTDGDFQVFIEKPFTILIILLPMLPAVFFEVSSNSKRKKCKKFVDENKLQMEDIE